MLSQCWEREGWRRGCIDGLLSPEYCHFTLFSLIIAHIAAIAFHSRWENSGDSTLLLTNIHVDDWVGDMSSLVMSEVWPWWYLWQSRVSIKTTSENVRWEHCHGWEQGGGQGELGECSLGTQYCQGWGGGICWQNTIIPSLTFTDIQLLHCTAIWYTLLTHTFPSPFLGLGAGEVLRRWTDIKQRHSQVNSK